jgi:hypothetical protein
VYRAGCGTCASGCVWTRCFTFVGSSAYLGLSAQSRSDAMQVQIDRLRAGQDLAQEIRFMTADVTGWQALVLTDGVRREQGGLA